MRKLFSENYIVHFLALYIFAAPINLHAEVQCKPHVATAPSGGEDILGYAAVAVCSDLPAQWDNRYINGDKDYRAAAVIGVVRNYGFDFLCQTYEHVARARNLQVNTSEAGTFLREGVIGANSCASVISIDRRKASSNAATCGRGNPICPLTGVKRQPVETGLQVGFQSLRLAYDSSFALWTSVGIASLAGEIYV